MHVLAALTQHPGLLELVPGSGPCRDSQGNRWGHVRDIQSASMNTYRVKMVFKMAK